MSGPDLNQRPGYVRVSRGRIKPMFWEFLENWRDAGGKLKYVEKAEEMLSSKTGRTLQVSLKEIESYNSLLADTIKKEYSNVYAHLCSAVKFFLQSQVKYSIEDKDYFVSIMEGMVYQKVTNPAS